MLDSIKQVGKSLGRELNRAWDGLSEGWRELLTRSSEALTQFAGGKAGGEAKRDSLPATFPRWSLLAGEVEETERDLVVRVELPGIDKDDCRITIDGNMLHVSGEKHYERETIDSTYHVMERAYGVFERSIPLPRNVDGDKAVATCRNGVLTVRLPKQERERVRSVPVS